jgi:membrane dipeptidase
MLTSAALGASFGSQAAQDPSHRRLIINALGGIENPNLQLQRPPGTNPVDTATPDVDARALHDAHVAGLTAVNVTLGYVGGPGDPFEYTLQTIRVWDEIVSRHAPDLVKVLHVQDILQAQRSGRIGVIFGFQNAAMMGNDAARARLFARLGVRVIQLTYNPANQLGDGCMAAANRGLTAFGREVVAQLNDARVMVDLSHSGEHTCLDAARISRAPISINHTGCRQLANLPRNKTDAELRLVASRGGFIGIFFMPFLNVDGHPHAGDVVAHLEHAINVCGEDHVGVGTDGDVTGIDDLNAYRARLAAEVANRRRSGVGAAGESSETYPFIVDLRGPGQFDRLAELLRRRGHSEARVEKILGGNFLRFAREVWGT